MGEHLNVDLCVLTDTYRSKSMEYQISLSCWVHTNLFQFPSYHLQWITKHSSRIKDTKKTGVKIRYFTQLVGKFIQMLKLFVQISNKLNLTLICLIPVPLKHTRYPQTVLIRKQGRETILSFLMLFSTAKKKTSDDS